ncbi:MAG: hypothetical protein WDN09_02665 [bacterium]
MVPPMPTIPTFSALGRAFRPPMPAIQTFFGLDAGSGATDAFKSVFIGYSAGYAAENAARSVFIGEGAGGGTTIDTTADSDDFSIAIGHNATPDSFKKLYRPSAAAPSTPPRTR